MDREKTDAPGLSPTVLALREELASGALAVVCSLPLGTATADVAQGRDSLWVLLRRLDGSGFALRTAYAPGGLGRVETLTAPSSAAEFRVSASVGEYHVWLHIPAAARWRSTSTPPREYHVWLHIPDPDRPLLHATVGLTPADDLLVPYWPRDLYVLGAGGDPAAPVGRVRAAQRGLNAGLVYLTLEEPEFGSLLYFQNLTALNDYSLATGTAPDGRVGGRWPKLGYAPSVSEEKPLPKGREVVLSDVFLHWSAERPADPRASCRLFLELLAGVYAHLERPDSLYHDWPGLAEKTLRDLERAPEATVRQYGNLYLRPYVDAEYPDSMVQLTTLMPIREYRAWSGGPVPLADELRAGVKRFFDPELGTIRRYLPSVAKDPKSGKDADEVDSWYLYHPLANLGRLALEGDAEARGLFLGSLDYAIKVARHFRYSLPVLFDVRTLAVKTGPRKPGEPGQSDAGAVYACVMLQAWDLTREDRYLDEAKKAIEAVRDREFDLEYQANLSAWGANACLRLWRITGEEFYRDQSYVFLANLFHNSLIWESQIGTAQHYPVFLGMTCLHDGPYMALYECFECFAAAHEHLALGGADLPDSVRLLLTEYCKYTPSRAWFYYPAHLPKEALAQEVRNGHIDRNLAFPVEDLYGDGQLAGQVGQEIYGSGAAFTFVTRSYHRLKQAPVLLFCEYPLAALEQPDEPCVSFQARGVAGFSCRARLIPLGRRPLPRITAREEETGLELPGSATPEGHREFTVPAGRPIELRWEA